MGVAATWVVAEGKGVVVSWSKIFSDNWVVSPGQPTPRAGI